jgi:exosortase E/protease (VPEID-CTERM system)
VWLARSIALIILRVVEVRLLIPYGVADPARWQAHAWLWMVPGAERGVPGITYATIVLAAILSWAILKDRLRSAIAFPPRWGWLRAHLISLVTLVGWSAIGHGDPSLYWTLWIWIRVALEVTALATWLAALVPPSFWFGWIRRAPEAFVTAGVFALMAKIVNHLIASPWEMTRAATFKMVGGILVAIGQEVTLSPASSEITVRDFVVRVTPSCSGLDGVAITFGLLSLYLIVYRRDLRFPLALLLLPAGVALAWILNSVRIASLVMIGTWSPSLAIDGFHSVAGWLSLSLVSCGLVLASQRLAAFRKDSLAVDSAPNPAAPFLVPMLAIIATALISRAIHPGFDLLYPARVVVVALALWHYRRELTAYAFAITPFAIAVGIVVFLGWILLARRCAPTVDAAFAAGLDRLSPPARFTWLLFRIIGATVTAPIAEELAFRGYVLRKLIADDFSAVGFDRPTWLSFVGSSILFGALHGKLIAGTLAGMAFALVLYRRAELGDSIVAHAATNILLSAWVLVTGRWCLWH